MALGGVAQAPWRPFQTRQSRAHDLSGSLLFGLPHLFSAHTFRIGRLYGRKQFLPELWTAQNPSASHLFIHFLVILPATQFHTPAKLRPTRRAVPRDACLAHHPIHAQPFGPARRSLQVSGIAAPAEVG